MVSFGADTGNSQAALPREVLCDAGRTRGCWLRLDDFGRHRLQCRLLIQPVAHDAKGLVATAAELCGEIRNGTYMLLRPPAWSRRGT